VRTPLAILMAVLLAACESKPRGPVALGRDDACASCRMLISERRYAAQLIDRDGEIYKFDDVACMLRFAHSHAMQQSSAKFYVRDYASGGDWLDAATAYFVRQRASVSSPMGSGIVAFRDVQSAATASQKGETPFAFAEIWSQQTVKMNSANR
jgi:copper chaperone NosL